MENNNEDFSLEEFEHLKQERRRDLLPWWIKIFCWIFMLFGTLAIVSLVAGIMGLKSELAFYGIETDEPLSVLGLTVIIIALLKGITAFALWFEKDFAIKIGIIDAVIGIMLCVISMFNVFSLEHGFGVTIRLELVLLIPFLIKLNKIQEDWDSVA